MIEYSTGAFIGECSETKLLTVLEQVHSDESCRNPSLGICAGVDHCFREEGKIFDSHDGATLKYLMSYWPKYSGQLFYPVPSDEPELDAKEKFHSCDDCWNRDTAYGQLRWELLEFCIQRLKDRIYEDKIS